MKVKKERYVWIALVISVLAMIVFWVMSSATYDDLDSKKEDDEVSIEKYLVEASYNHHPEASATLDTSSQEELISNKLHEINGNGYQMITIERNRFKLLQENPLLVEIEMDVMMEKEGLYDWMRLSFIVQNEEILSMERTPIDFYHSLTPTLSIPDEAYQTIERGILSLASEDRSDFGIDKRAYHIGSNGIQAVEALQIKPVASNEDQTEILAQVSIQIDTFHRVVTQDYLLFMKQFEGQKWQIEDIKEIGG